MVIGSFDIGGQGFRISQAFRKHAPGWVLRSLAKAQSYLAYPMDLPYRTHTLEDLYQKADVVHVRNDFVAYDRLAAKFGPKPVLIHYHGSKFRGNPEHYLREQRKRGAIGLVSTLDLWLLGPDDLTWLPAPYDVDWLEAMA